MIALAIHGGAGDAAGRVDWTAHRTALHDIAADGVKRLQSGARALDVVEHLVMRLEEDPLFNAGVGAVLNHDGQPELDAAIMDGAGRRCGAVASISRIASPVQLARAVLEHSPHVLLVGTGAEAFGRARGLREVTPDYFVTEERFRQLKDAHRRNVVALDHESAFATEPSPESGDAAGGTVGAVALDHKGHLAAATSTGGMTNKPPGRVGDTPIIGAGTFADNASAAVSCTGTGEAFIRAGFGFHVHARLAYGGADLDAACAEGLEQVRKFGGRGGCIAIDRHGRVVVPFNSKVMFRAWLDGARVRVGIGADDA